jgi:hypothetical protein
VLPSGATDAVAFAQPKGGGAVDANGRFEFQRRLGGAVWVLTLRDHPGGGPQPTLDDALAVVSGAATVVVDVSFAHLDSADLATLIRHARPVRGQPERLTLAAKPGSPGRGLLDVGGVKRLVRVYDTADDAIATARGHMQPPSRAYDSRQIPKVS